MNLSVLTVVVSVALAAVSYLIGSINFAIIFTRIFAHVDIRDYGSGNAGMTNVLRTAGKLPGILTFLCDFLKGAVSVSLGRFGAAAIIEHYFGNHHVNPLVFALVGGLFCMLGHVYPLYYHFRGGKGVASLAGIMLVVDWRVMIVCVSVFLIVLCISKIVSISSVIAAISLPFVTYIMYDSSVAYATVLLGMSQRLFVSLFAGLFTVVVVFKHRSNMVRLFKGEERKITDKKKAKSTEEK